MSNTKEKSTDLRCAPCNRKLAEGEVIKLKIKCPRCGQLNEFKNTPAKREGPCETTSKGEERKPSRGHLEAG